MRIGFGIDLARTGVDETITGLWTFNEILTLLDALHFEDIPFGTTQILRARVLGDTDDRLSLVANGVFRWGGGSGGTDTNLFRSGPDSLKTDDSFVVGASLITQGAVRLSVNSVTLAAQADDFDLDGKTFQRFELTGAQNMSGIAGGAQSTMVVILNADSIDSLTLLNNDVGSVAANRMNLPGLVDLVIPKWSGAILMYDTLETRWFVVSTV